MKWDVVILCSAVLVGEVTAETLNALEKQRLNDRVFQAALRGPRLTGSYQQNSLIESISAALEASGLATSKLPYSLDRWDPRTWSLEATLKNGTQVGFETTGYYPYSGNTGAIGVVGKVHDAGTYAVDPATQTSVFSSLDLSGLSAGTIAFFDNPSVTKNYSLPGYKLWGTSRDIPASDIPELGNLTNPHWISAKQLDFPKMNSLNVSAVILSWTDASDANAALQWLPNKAPAPGADPFTCPTLYVGNSTGEEIRSLIKAGQIDSMKVTLDAPTFESDTYTLLGHLKGTKDGNDTILLYTHSDGPTVVEENGPLMMLTIAEYFAKNPIGINLDLVITTGHLSGGQINESDWMGQRPDLLAHAKASINIEHLGAVEWKDVQTPEGPVYTETGLMEPMWTFANLSCKSSNMRKSYLTSFADSPDYLRMALLSPLTVNGKQSSWYGVGGSSVLGYSSIPTVGIIPQPDYLWASMVDGGWSRYNNDQAVAQIEALIRLIKMLDSEYVAGNL